MTAVEQASREFMWAAEVLPTLYSLAAEWDTLLVALQAPEPDEAEIDAELDRVAHDIKQKGHGIAVVIQGLEIKAANLKLEEQRLAFKRKAAENAAERLRAYTLAQLKVIGIDRLDYGAFTLSIRQNPPSVIITSAADVPHQFERTKIEVSIDKRAILEHFKATGKVVDGVSIERGERLSIA